MRSWYACSRDDPDLVARIKPLVKQLAKEDAQDDKDMKLFIDELRKRYKDVTGITLVDEEELSLLGEQPDDVPEPKSGYDEEGYLEVIEKGEDAATRKEKE